MTENDTNRNERLQVKSRPRPGGTSVNQSGNLIAPPPTIQRRTSTTSNPATSSSATVDLISFTSLPTNNDIMEFENQK